VERTFTIPYEPAGGSLLLRNLRDDKRTSPLGPAVLYVHGATFPSALSLFWRFDGVSWADKLVDAGFDAWGFDFIGFGGSSRPIKMSRSPSGVLPVGRANDAARQMETVVDFIRKEQKSFQPIDNRTFLGDHRNRPLRRASSGSDWSAGILRTDHTADPAGLTRPGEPWRLAIHQRC
jgi:pimeloyl-ACP methyl ester carboxylesterase